ncbi:MAG TPA: hypothetical protein DDY77_01780 [Clostridiales bacterium]|nr:hypothetical protein [Clostridiales bacterium]
MSFLNKTIEVLKSKKFLRIFTVALSLVLIGVFALVTILSSYIPWKDYYDKAVAEKEHQKYLNSLPFEFLGISMELSDGVRYYTDGRANPKKGDFEVTAHFTEKGKDSDTILSTDEFTIEVPETFSEKGGTIKASYTYQPEDTKDDKGETVTPEPITKTATIDISLTKVALSKLELTENPYRVHYSDAMKFDPEGIKLNATYNNGDVIALEEKDIKVLGDGKLTADTKAVKVSYELDGTSLDCDVPVTVQTAATFSEGNVIKLETEGEVSLSNGADTSTAEPIVRATYDTGNRLIIGKDEYSVKGNVKNASFEKNCILTVSYKGNENISCKTAASVVSGFESEDGTATTIVGGTKKTVTDVNGAQVGVTEGFKKGNTIGFNISASAINKGQLALRLANKSSSAVKLANVMSLKVNGREVPIDARLSLAAASDKAKYDFTTLIIATPLLKAQSNGISIAFEADADVAFDLAEYSTKYDGVFYSSMDEYITQCLTKGITPQLIVSMSSDWQEAFVKGSQYLHGMCSDGKNYYVAHSAFATERAIRISKHDVETGKIIATSPLTEAKSNETYASCAYIDGKIVAFYSDGTFVAINSDLKGEWESFDGLKFKDEREENAIDFTGKPVKDVFYNGALQKYAAFIGNQVYIFNKDMVLETQFSPARDDRMRMSGSTDYIYVSTSADGKYQPNIQIYDWSGKKVGTAVIPNTQEIMDEGVINAGSHINLAKVNSQGIVTMNDSWYISFSCWQQSAAGIGDRGCVIKVDYPQISDDLDMTFSTGEYYDIANDQGKTLSATPSSLKLIEKSGWSMDGVSDGTYIYYMNNTSGNGATTVYKYNPLTDETVARSAQNTHKTEGDNSKAFIKDGKVCYIAGGKVYSCKLDEFVNNCEFKEDSSFEEINTFGKAFAAAWSDIAGRYAIIAAGKLNILSGSGVKIATDIAVANAKSVTADDKYVYVVRSANKWDNNPIEIFTWDGVKVGTLGVSGYESNATLAAENWFNVQGVYMHNGNLYCVVAGAKMGFNVVSVDIDLSGLTGIKK